MAGRATSLLSRRSTAARAHRGRPRSPRRGDTQPGRRRSVARLKDGVEARCDLGAAARARSVMVLASDDGSADRSLGRVVVGRDPRVVDKAGESIPDPDRVGRRLADLERFDLAPVYGARRVLTPFLTGLPAFAVGTPPLAPPANRSWRTRGGADDLCGQPPHCATWALTPAHTAHSADASQPRSGFGDLVGWRREDDGDRARGDRAERRALVTCRTAASLRTL